MTPAILGLVGIVSEAEFFIWLIRRDKRRQGYAQAVALLATLRPVPARVPVWHEHTAAQLAPGAARPGEPSRVRPYVEHMPWIEPGAMPRSLRCQLVIAGTVSQALVAYNDPARQVTS